MLVIDGSYGEGGGQILRTSIALSCITGRDVKIINIRAKRPNPGLRRQHITAIEAAAKICCADVEGLEVGSKVVTFRPGSIKGGEYMFNIGTAGSITLVLQTLLPIMAFAPSSVKVRIIGGTDVPWSPPIDYLRNVIVKHLSRLGLNVEVKLFRRGHYPRGGGEVEVFVSSPPRELSPITLTTRGDVVRIEGNSHCVKLPKHVAERQARAAEAYLRKSGFNVPINIGIEWYEPSKDPHLGPGSGIVLWAITKNSILGGDSLGAKGKRAEVVGEEAASKLVKDLSTGMALDRHMSDNIVPYIALAKGTSEVGCAELTMHAYTNLWLVKKILNVEPEVDGDLGKPFRLRVKGIGITY